MSGVDDAEVKAVVSQQLPDESILQDGGKACKKNAKRKSKKMTVSGSTSNSTNGLNHKEMIAALEVKLQEAKAEKDHKRAGVVREQIWVLKDLSAGVRTAIPAADLEKIIESIHVEFHPPSSSAQSSVSTTMATSSVDVKASSSGTPSVSMVPVVAGLPEDKRIKTLRKKLEQIQNLKERQKIGEKLEINQIEKIKQEAVIQKEIDELEEILETVTLKTKIVH